MRNKKPLVSILICTKDSEKYLEKTLKSAKEQTYSNIELIVVDHKDSKDKSRLIAKKYADRLYIYGPERSAQYNYAAKKAKGKYIYRIDSDFILDKNLVAECVKRCEEGSYDGVAPHNTSDDSLGFWSRVRKLERDCYVDDTLIVGLRFMKRKIFLELGGFDEKMYAGEDYDLHNRFEKKGHKWARVSAKEVHLGEVTSLWDFTKKSYSYGKNLTYYMNKHPERGKKQMAPLRGAYIRHINQMTKDPILTLGLVVMTLVKFSAGGLGYILCKIGIQKPDKK